MISLLHFRLIERQSVDLVQPKSFITETLEGYLHPEVFKLISSHIDIDSPGTKIIETSELFNIDTLGKDEIKDLVNLKRVNDIRYLNKYFEAINRRLNSGSYFIGCAETYDQRKERIFRRFPFGFSHIFYVIDFIYKRIFPKWSITKWLYFYITHGMNRVLSRAEVLGRLISCGFRIVEVKDIKGHMYFVTIRSCEPAYDLKPSYGLLFKMNRLGKDGKNIGVYKFRTMHPFAEYLQEYVYSMNNLDEGGKFKDDFRITAWGKVLRKLWIDELPMLVNFFSGDLKLVGVRPLSNHYLSLYDEEFQKRRIKYKPGLIPPYYADMPKKLDDIILSEINYLDQFDKHPVKTDIKYFFKSFYNIIFKGARSR